MRRPHRGKFVNGSTNILLIAYHTSRHINDMRNSCDHGFFVFSMATTKRTLCTAQCLQGPDEPSVCFLSHLKQDAYNWLIFVQLW